MSFYIIENSKQRSVQIDIDFNTPSYPTKMGTISISKAPTTRDGATLASDSVKKLSEALNPVKIHKKKTSKD